MFSSLLPVNEVFTTIQGEATFTGMPSLFVRLQGCPVGCSFCDTKYTWEHQEHKEKAPDEILAKNGKETDEWGNFSVEKILELAKGVPHVVITGGEPFIHDLTDLTTAVIGTGRTVQVETSGTHTMKCHPDTFITLSPKIGMMGRLEVLPLSICLADEIKMPVGKEEDLEKLETFLKSNSHRKKPIVPIWLQPLSQSPKATKLCIETCLDKGYRLSVQTHKYIGVQ